MKEKRLLVLGGGESGVGTAILAKQKGYEVFLSDRGNLADKYRVELEKRQIDFEEGKHSFEKFFEFTEVVKSPGIPDHLEFIQEFIKRSVPVISEIEFACRYTTSCIVAITGSNGKTTTTNLLYNLLKQANKDVALVGNVGQSFAWAVAEHPAAYYALELSSFQLDGVYSFKPQVSILLNISPDHLDRYDYDFDKYADSKLRIAMNQSSGDLFIHNAKDEKTLDRLSGLDDDLSLNAISMDQLDAYSTFNWDNIALQGIHNRFNAACAIEAVRHLGLSDTEIQKGLSTFVNDPHRMEQFHEFGGMSFINDSKATNVEAVYYALDALKEPAIWIAGGVDKGNDYGDIEELVLNKVEAIICLGIDNSPLMNYFGEKKKRIASVDNLEAMVDKIKEWGSPGRTVILSPACASFDLFNNYMHRGDQFKEIIRKQFS